MTSLGFLVWPCAADFSKSGLMEVATTSEKEEQSSQIHHGRLFGHHLRLVHKRCMQKGQAQLFTEISTPGFAVQFMLLPTPAQVTTLHTQLIAYSYSPHPEAQTGFYSSVGNGNAYLISSPRRSTQFLIKALGFKVPSIVSGAENDRECLSLLADRGNYT